MSKLCEICGRRVITGRKYCWEHRNTTQAKNFQGAKTIRDATQSYHNSQYFKKTQERDKVLIKLIGGIGLLWLILAFLIKSINKEAFLPMLGLGILVVPILSWFIGMKYYKIDIALSSERITKEADKKIRNRDPEYINHVKGHVADEREEKEFRKSLLK